MSTPILTLEVRVEEDVVLARQRARQIATLLGFDIQERTRVAAAASEVARLVSQGGGGTVEFLFDAGAPQSLLVRVRGRGLRPVELQAILDGDRGADDETGSALVAARRLTDRFRIEPDPGGGATVAMAKSLPKRARPIAAQDLARVAEDLARDTPRGPLDEVRQQNQELLQALDELRQRQAEMAELNRELEETNRGVVALYAELDEKANSLRRVSDLKSRFLSNMSHEFRSPLNSVLSLTRFLLERSDGELTPEQEKQVALIRRAAEGLLELVNDLLDLAKVEAGKVTVRPSEFDVAELFGTLRGMIRPVLAHDSVTLVFEVPGEIPPLETDEGKVAQILRNFLTNALKFTERGEVRVSASRGAGDSVVFSVSDTGIGIAPEDQARIFEEFGQVDSPVQAKVKGTGLGLPLSRRLAELLGGRVSVRSTPGAGSTFSAVLPRIYRSPAASRHARKLGPGRTPVLVVEDDLAAVYLYEKYVEGTEFQVLSAPTADEALEVIGEVRPSAVVLDIFLGAESGWTLLSTLKRQESTRDIPVLVLSVAEVREKAVAMGADEFHLKPVERAWFLNTLDNLTGQEPSRREGRANHG